MVRKFYDTVEKRRARNFALGLLFDNPYNKGALTAATLGGGEGYCVRDINQWGKERGVKVDVINIERDAPTLRKFEAQNLKAKIFKGEASDFIAKTASAKIDFFNFDQMAHVNESLYHDLKNINKNKNIDRIALTIQKAKNGLRGRGVWVKENKKRFKKADDVSLAVVRAGMYNYKILGVLDYKRKYRAMPMQVILLQLKDSAK